MYNAFIIGGGTHIIRPEAEHDGGKFEILFSDTLKFGISLKIAFRWESPDWPCRMHGKGFE